MELGIGEYAALGTAQNGKPWSVELAANGETIPLPPGRALAVSAGSGHTFDPEGRFHHIFRPEDGASTRPDSTIVVTAPTATIADALSTTFTVASVLTTSMSSNESTRLERTAGDEHRLRISHTCKPGIYPGRGFCASSRVTTIQRPYLFSV